MFVRGFSLEASDFLAGLTGVAAGVRDIELDLVNGLLLPVKLISNESECCMVFVAALGGGSSLGGFSTMAAAAVTTGVTDLAACWSLASVRLGMSGIQISGVGDGSAPSAPRPFPIITYTRKER